MRDEPLEEGRRWLRQAQEDLRWARHLAQEGAYHLACFLSQQVAEKAVNLAEEAVTLVAAMLSA
jgi:HEPN domain-containing protein